MGRRSLRLPCALSIRGFLRCTQSALHAGEERLIGELQGCRLRVMGCELRVTSCGLRVASYRFFPSDRLVRLTGPTGHTGLTRPNLGLPTHPIFVEGLKVVPGRRAAFKPTRNPPLATRNFLCGIGEFQSSLCPVTRRRCSRRRSFRRALSKRRGGTGA